MREHGYNHKVISVESIDERADVYCLQVEKYHNFALAAGVFVHNCGMIAVRTQFTAADMREPGRPGRAARGDRAGDPAVGGTLQPGALQQRRRGRVEGLEQRGARTAPAIAPNWRLQLGSLGSGNHFIEVSLDEEDRVWLFLHSGSRGVGNKLANRHIKIAQELSRAAGGSALPDPDLAYLAEGTGVLGLHPRPAVGPALRAAEPRGDDAPGRRLPPGVERRDGGGGRDGELPPQLHGRATTSAKRGAGCPARAPSTRPQARRG